MSDRLFNTKTSMTPRSEQVTIDPMKGIGNPGEGGLRRSQADITVPNGVTNLRNAGSK